MQEKIDYTLIEVSNWTQFEDKLRILFYPPIHHAWIFRGQSIFEHTLQPSLQRIFTKNGISRRAAIALEREATYQFRTHAPLLISNYLSSTCNSDIDWWGIMQHYGSPSRFLDWTYSPYVAAYFACENNFEKDGAIWVFNNIAVGEYLKKIGIPVHDDGSWGTKLCQNHESPDYLISVESKIKTERMVAQQGLFTYSSNPLNDHAVNLSNIMKEIDAQNMFLKIVINKDAKMDFVHRLNYMNITASTLFPGIEGLGKSIREFLNIAINSNEKVKKVWEKQMASETKVAQ